MRNSDIVIHRLNSQHLSAGKFKNPADVVRWLGAVQAQDYNAAKWAVALRSENATDLSIEQAFNKGEILRTHVMRPTWHFVTPKDIRWMLELTSPRVNAVCGHYYRKFDLDERFFRRAHKVIARGLEAEGHLTRIELRDRLLRHRIEPGDATRMSFILLRAELDGLVCSGPRRGKQFTYELLDRRVPGTKKISRDEALANLTLRYFTSHGPATAHDYAWWSGLAMSDVRSGLELAGKKLQREREHYFSAVDGNGIPDAVLLPPYDEYLVGYTDRSATVAPISGEINLPNAIFKGVVLVRGLVKGDWRRKNGPKEIVIEVNNWAQISKVLVRALERVATRYRDFIGLPTRIDLRSRRT
jgi:hypothetical protein